jgi:hypothetical protein
MPNLFQRMWGISPKNFPFTPVHPVYIPERMILGEDQGSYQGENIIISGGLLGEGGAFLLIRQSNSPLKKEAGSKCSEEIFIKVSGVDIEIHREPMKINEIKLETEDKRRVYANWQRKGIYFLLISEDVPLSETVKVITSMVV